MLNWLPGGLMNNARFYKMHAAGPVGSICERSSFRSFQNGTKCQWCRSWNEKGQFYCGIIEG